MIIGYSRTFSSGGSAFKIEDWDHVDTTWGTTVSSSIPTHSSGDFLVTWVSTNDTSTSFTAPSGWTEATNFTINTLGDRCWVYYKAAASSSETFSMVFSANVEHQSFTIRISGGATAIASVGAEDSGWSATATSPTTTASNGDLEVHFCAGGDRTTTYTGNTPTAPTSLSSITDGGGTGNDLAEATFTYLPNNKSISNGVTFIIRTSDGAASGTQTWDISPSRPRNANTFQIT